MQLHISFNCRVFIYILALDFLLIVRGIAFLFSLTKNSNFTKIFVYWHYKLSEVRKYYSSNWKPSLSKSKKYEAGQYLGNNSVLFMLNFTYRLQQHFARHFSSVHFFIIKKFHFRNSMQTYVVHFRAAA